MLLEARGNDHSAVQATIDKLVTECAGICASLAMSNPSAIRTMHCSNFDGAMIVQQGPSSSKWLSISVSPNPNPSPNPKPGPDDCTVVVVRLRTPFKETIDVWPSATPHS